MKKVLFVCTGNTCRSSMAEAIARKLVEEREETPGIEFASAGIYAAPGDKASHQAVEAVAEWGIDLNKHRARQISQDFLEEADLILTMTESHKRSLLRIKPGLSTRIYTLKEYVDGTGGDIQDPFGQPVFVYRECALELREYIKKAIDKLMKS